MMRSNVRVSNATSSVIDPNKGKPGYKLNPNTGLYELPPANPQGMDWNFNEQTWSWEPPSTSTTRYKLVGDSEPTVIEEDPEGTTSGFNINQEPPKLEDDTALISSSSEPLADVPSVPVETDQDVANKYIEAIKADPLGKVITVDGKALTATTPAVQRLVSIYSGSLEHDRLVTAAQEALTPTVNVSQATREAVGDTGPVKDPNENREGYYQSKSSLKWVPLPPNPGGLDWTFDYQTESWSPPTVEPTTDDSSDRTFVDDAPTTSTEPNLSTLIEGVDIDLSSEQTNQLSKAFGRGGEEEFNRVLTEIKELNAQAALPPANNPYAFQKYQQRIAGGELSGGIGDDIYEDPNLTSQQKTDLLQLISNTRANNAASEDDTTSLEDEGVIIDPRKTDSDAEGTGNGVVNLEDLLPERSTDDVTIGGETPEGDTIYDPKTDPNAPEYNQPGGQGYIALEKQNLIEFERYKEILIKEPDKDIGINNLFSTTPDVARMIVDWMATDEYSNAQRIYRLKNPVATNGADTEGIADEVILRPEQEAKLEGENSQDADFTTDPENLLEEKTIDEIRADPNAFRDGYAKHPYTGKWTELPPNDKGEGATWNQASWRWDAKPGVGGQGDSSLPPVDESTVDVDVTPEQPGLPTGLDTETGDTSEIEDPNVGRDGYYERPSSGKWELAPPMPEEMIPGPGAINPWDMPTFDPESWTWKAAESREAFLSRMPAVPGHLDLTGAVGWLADQDGVDAEDAKRWIFWARETGRTPTEEPVEPIETLLARLPTVPSSMSNVPGMTWLMEKLIEQGVLAEDAEKDAQRWFDWANETNRKVDEAEQPDLGDEETEEIEEIEEPIVTDFDSLVASAGIELDAEQLATLRKAFKEGGPVRFESVLNKIKGTDFLEEEEEEELLTEAGSDLDVTAEEEEPIEEFLARLPAIPSDLSNIDAFMVLVDAVHAGTISGDDALRWNQWARENRDDPSDDWKDETTPTEPTEAETIQNKIRLSQEFLTNRVEGLGDPNSPYRELTAQEINLLEGAYRSGGEAAYNELFKRILNSKRDNYASIMGEGKDVIPKRSLEEYASISPYLDGERAKYLVERFGLENTQVIRAGEIFKADGEDALAGYLKAFQNGTLEEWEANYAEVLANREGDRAEAGDEVIVDSLYTYGTPEYEAAVANISIEDILLKIPEPPAGLDILERVFWLADQVDEEGNPLLSPHEAMVYADWAREQQANTDANTSVEGEGGMGNAGDPANLESIQSTIATEIENTVQDMGFNSEEYKASQTTAIEDRYQDARVRLGRQFAIDPGGPKTGRAQRQFELLENQRIQDLAALDSEVQDRLQAARDSTITNLVNAFSTITTGKMAEEQLDEQQRQFNTELRETVRQFNNDIAIRLKEFGLSETEIEAAIKKINSDIVNNTRAISADISQAWAEVTGDVGVPGGLLSLEDLGIPESEWAMFPYMPPSEDMKNSIRMSFSAMLGRDITDGELDSLIANGRINVEDNMPTQKAKEFAATIMQQNMERISKYDAIAAENGLDRDKFNDAKDRADKEWNRINLEVAEQYGLDSNKFRNAMWDLDQRLTDVFFNPDLTEEQRSQQREDAINNVIISHGYQERQEQGAFLQAKDQYDLLYGDRERAIATAFGIDGDAFARANKQADKQEERSSSVWASVFNQASVRNYGDPEAVGDIDSTWLVEGRRWNSDNAQFITFRNEINDWVKDVSGFTLGELNIKPPGDPSIGPGVYTPDSLVSTLVQLSDSTNMDQLYSIFQNFADGKLMNDTLLQDNLVGYFNSAFTPDGNHKDGWKTGTGDMMRGTQDRPFFNLKAIDRDWFTDLSDSEQSAIMSLISGSNFSPEREAGGVSALSSIGRAFGIGVGAVGGAYIAAKTGNPAAIPAAISAGASVGAAATG